MIRKSPASDVAASQNGFAGRAIKQEDPLLAETILGVTNVCAGVSIIDNWRIIIAEGVTVEDCQ